MSQQLPDFNLMRLNFT